MSTRTNVVKGRLREGASESTGNGKLQRKGKTDRAVGKVKQVAGKALDKVKQVAKEARGRRGRKA